MLLNWKPSSLKRTTISSENSKLKTWFWGGLEDYIYGTDAAPPRLIDSNVNFVRHQKEDRLLIYWILASISTSYLRPIGWLLLFTSNMYNHWTIFWLSIHYQSDVLQETYLDSQERLSYYDTKEYLMKWNASSICWVHLIIECLI